MKLREEKPAPKSTPKKNHQLISLGNEDELLKKL